MIQLTRYPDLEPPAAGMLVYIAKLESHRFLCVLHIPLPLSNDMCELKEITDTLLRLSEPTKAMRVSGLLMLGDLNVGHET